MIEMLGVLAIIGVLSAGGIMGYSKAMENYRTNKLVNDIVMMTAKLQSVFPKPSFGSEYDRRTVFVPVLNKLGIVGDDYAKTYDNSRTVSVANMATNYPVQSPFGTDMIITAHFYQVWDEEYENNDGTITIIQPPVGVLAVGINNLPKSACVKILTTMDLRTLGLVYAFWTKDWETHFSSPITVGKAENVCVGNSINMATYLFFAGKRTDN